MDKKEKTKNITLRFRATNRDIFEAIRSGKKKIETRAGSPKYFDIKAGDTLVFVCGKERFNKKVKSVHKFKSIKALHKIYKPIEINPKTKTIQESEKMYHSFSGYREKIKKYGLIALKLS
jgi:ASC-1-like (ASCH) protein